MVNHQGEVIVLMLGIPGRRLNVTSAERKVMLRALTEAGSFILTTWRVRSSLIGLARNGYASS